MPPQDVTIRAAEHEPELQAAQALLREYADYLQTFLDPALLARRAAERTEVPPTFLPPLGTLLLAMRGEEAAGCVALRHGEQQSELCRLYVRPAVRGEAIGWSLIQAALAVARALGKQAVVLNSVENHMEAAVRLYLRAGFRPTAPYEYLPIPQVSFYRLEL